MVVQSLGDQRNARHESERFDKIPEFELLVKLPLERDHPASF